jgi:hypothetical protein
MASVSVRFENRPILKMDEKVIDGRRKERSEPEEGEKKIL